MNRNYLNTGDTQTFTIYFRNNETLFNPNSIRNVRIINPNGDLVTTISPTRSSTGKYYISYTVPKNADFGTWTHRWIWRAESWMNYKTDDYYFVVGSFQCLFQSRNSSHRHFTFIHIEF